MGTVHSIQMIQYWRQAAVRREIENKEVVRKR